MMLTSRHGMICQDCLGMYAKSRLDDELVIPWIPCASEDCPIAIDYRDILDCQMDVKLLLNICRVIAKKRLSRYDNWVCCAGEDCRFGFLFEEEDEGKDRECEVCSYSHKIEKPENKMDDEFEKMVREGKLRPCPVCEQYAMKDFGMCNVMHCHKCKLS